MEQKRLYRSVTNRKICGVCGGLGDVPGASARDCGNYLDMNLPMAKYLAKRYLENVLYDIKEERLVYPE